MLIFRRSQHRLGFRVFRRFVLLVLSQLFELCSKRRVTFLADLYLSSQSVAAAIQSNDLVGFVDVFTLGTVAFENVIGVDLTKLSQACSASRAFCVVSREASSFALTWACRLSLDLLRPPTSWTLNSFESSVKCRPSAA